MSDPQALFQRWQGEGDHSAREALVRRFTPLVRTLARRYGRSSEPFEDLLQVGSVGLLLAIDRFDPDRGYSFASFAVPTILGEMRRYFRDSCWSVHMPRGTQERALKVRDARDLLSDRLGRAPTVGELAEYIELDVEEVLDALQALDAYESISIDTPPPGAAEDEVASYADTLGHPDEQFDLVDLDVSISAALKSLPAREREILRMRVVEDLTQTEIANRLGISQMQVSRLLRRPLERLRGLIDAPARAV